MSFIFLILEWYKHHKRPLPWRIEKNVYRVWLSEIILQQTRVNQGMAYYQKFTRLFPNIDSLAKAEEQQVLKLWQGLGYYSRARNLHKTAKIISTQFNNEFPTQFIELKKLPGIGPYTAAAIASICFDEKVPAIDGNAYRVYSRIFGLEKDISDSNALKFYFEFAQKIMPEKNPGDYNEAIMELGATVCLPQNPLCHQCPVNQHCVALETGKVELLPIKSKKIKVKKRHFKYYLILNKNTQEFLIQKRTTKDVWQNLFQFPLVEGKSQKLKFDGVNTKPILHAEIKHILTHQRLTIQFYILKLNENEFLNIKKSTNSIAILPKEIKKYPFPKPIFSFLDEFYEI